MVSRPQQWIEPMADAGVNLYTFHIEPVMEEVSNVCRKVRESGMKVGLALKPGTEVRYLPCIFFQQSIYIYTSLMFVKY